MYLTDNELVIRDASASDAEQLSEWWNDGAVMAHAGIPLGLGLSADEVRDIISRDTEDRRRLIIELSGRRVGEMSYYIFDDGGVRTAEIGIKICVAKEREKGYGSRLLSMLISALFAEYGCERVILDTNLKNKRAQHVYEKLGFVRVGLRVDDWKNQLGIPQTSIDYEMYPADFKPAKLKGETI